MAVTLRQIAKRANVTEMTVSNVLNERYPLVRSDAVKRARRIKAIAEPFSFEPGGTVGEPPNEPAENEQRDASPKTCTPAQGDRPWTRSSNHSQ